jgi:DNA-binding MarR family transcriptional regulator
LALSDYSCMSSINLEPPKVARELVANSGFLLARLGAVFKSRALARVELEGFEANHYSVLAMLAEGDRETQATIAEALGLDPSRLVNLLDSLEQRGLVARHRDPLDRRRHVVSITPEGIHARDRLRALAQGMADEFLAPLTPDDRKTLQRLLLQLARVHDPNCVFEDEN